MKETKKWASMDSVFFYLICCILHKSGIIIEYKWIQKVIYWGQTCKNDDTGFSGFCSTSTQYKSYSTGKIMIPHTNLINGHTETLLYYNSETSFTRNGKPWYSLNEHFLNITTSKK